MHHKYPRDGYDLQYDRSLPLQTSSLQGSPEELPNDLYIVKIIRLEYERDQVISEGTPS